MSIRRSIIIIFLCIAIQIYGNEKLILVTANHYNDTFQGRWLYLIYTEAFKRLDIEWEYQVYPAKRRDLLLDSGEVDGELSRVHSYGEKHPNLIRVETSPFSINHSLFTASTIQDIKNVRDLKDHNYLISYKRGAQRPKDILTKLISDGIIKEENIKPVNNNIIGLRNLVYLRIDLYISNSNTIRDLMLLDEFNNSSIKEILVLSETPIYCYLNIKHKQLSIDLSNTIKKLKNEGYVEQSKIKALNKMTIK